MEVQTFTTDRGPPTLAMSFVSVTPLIKVYVGLFICVSWFIEICSKQTLGRCCPNRPMFTDLLIPWPWKPSTAVPFGGLDIPWSTCPPSWLRFVPELSSWWGEEAQLWKKKGFTFWQLEWFYYGSHGPCTDDLPIWNIVTFFVAMLNYQRVMCDVSKAIINHLPFTIHKCVGFQPSEHVWLNY